MCTCIYVRNKILIVIQCVHMCVHVCERSGSDYEQCQRQRSGTALWMSRLLHRLRVSKQSGFDNPRDYTMYQNSRDSWTNLRSIFFPMNFDFIRLSLVFTKYLYYLLIKNYLFTLLKKIWHLFLDFDMFKSDSSWAW